MSSEWRPDQDTQEDIGALVEALFSDAPEIMGIDETIPACEVTNLDPYAVGLGTFPRYIQVALRGGYRVDAWYRGGIAGLIVTDLVTVLHMRDGDRYEVLGPGGPHPHPGVPSATARGDILLANATPEWAVLNVGAAAGYALVTNAVPTATWDQTPSWTGLHTFGAGLTCNVVVGTFNAGVAVSANGLNFTGATGVNYTAIPDNLADAWHLVDTGALEYLQIVSTNAQPVIHFNQDNADIDFHVGATGRPNAFFVQGSDGFVGIGTNTPSQALDLIGAFEMEDTTTATTGVVYKGANRFIHNFHHPVGGGAVPDGRNTFVGELAGNFTMGAGATVVSEASYNTAVGYTSLLSNTTGYANTAVGYTSLNRNTTGYINTAMGHASLNRNTTGYANTAVGYVSLYSNTTGYANTAMGGYASLYSNTTGYANTAVGYASLNRNTTGYANTAVGSNAGRYISGGVNPNQISNTSVYLGAETKALASGDSNEIVIGYNATGLGSNTAILGNTNITITALRANTGVGTTTPDRLLHAEASDVATNATTYAVRLSHVSTGATAAGFGVGMEFELEDGGGAMQVASEITALWADPAAGVESPLLRISTYPPGGGHGPGYSGFWTWGLLDNVARTVIPNLPAGGDVRCILRVMYALCESGGGTAAGEITATPGGGAVQLYNDGVDIFSLTVAAAGSVTVQRTAGAATAELALWLVWV